MGPVVMLVNVTSQGRVEPSTPPPTLPPARIQLGGKGREVGGTLALAGTGPPRPLGVLGK